MKALVINRYGGPEELRLEEIKKPVAKHGEVIVKVHAAGINPIDYKIRNGSMRVITGKKFPKILGGDIAGIIEEIKDQNSGYHKGDKVFALLPGTGGYAEFAAVKEKYIYHVPKGITLEQAAATPMAALTALEAMRVGREVRSGDRVLINGASGGVGSFAVQVAKASGAIVTAVCSSANLEFVKQLGADRVIDYKNEDFTKLPDQFDRIFDAVAKTSFSESRKNLKNKGIFVSTLPTASLICHRIFNFLLNKKVFILRVKPSGKDLGVIADLIEKKEVLPHVSRIFSFSQAATAHQSIESQRVRGKIVFSLSLGKTD